MPDLDDVRQFWGGDLELSPTGDLGRVSVEDRSQLRVLRRLLTNPGDYLFHKYGAGIPATIGSVVEPAKARATIRGQMRKEPSVARTPEPAITVTPITNGLSAQINYVVQPGAIPVVLSFNVSA
jgi:hypothetical protein